MHTKMHKLLAAAGGRIDAVFYCPHSPEETCNCRKPLPGLFEQIGERYGMDLSGVHTVGDSLRDLQSGAMAGCATHLVHTGKSERLKGHALPANFPTGTLAHADLGAFADWLLAQPDAASKTHKAGAKA
jgi:D-glycero-D-manno-heptose 1,7-bisphosphate phosphatase